MINYKQFFNEQKCKLQTNCYHLIFWHWFWSLDIVIYPPVVGRVWDLFFVVWNFNKLSYGTLTP